MSGCVAPIIPNIITPRIFILEVFLSTVGTMEEN